MGRNKGEGCNTVDDKTWRGIQDRALRANPQLQHVNSEESVRRARIGGANFDKREQN